jgi:deazaflavin-dependent oxidoreductase (nitroreductase family)
MGTVLAKVIGGLLFVLAAMAAVLVAGMRRRSPAVTGAVRGLSRATKRLPLKSAGRSRAYTSVVRHTGRTSGREYQTPVHAVATADGFAIALPYGPDSDWVKNLRARGTAVIVHHGTEYRVDHPVLVPPQAAEDSFSPQDRRAHRLFGVTRVPHLPAGTRGRAELAHREFSATLTSCARRGGCDGIPPGRR